MKKMKYYSVLSLLFLSPLFFSCGSQNKVAGNFEYNTECYGTELDGSLTLKAWGNGRHRWDAVEQAKKNGIRDVIFKGISYGRDECDRRPLISEPNALDKYSDYFNKFFADEGPYLDFVNLKDERIFFAKVWRSRKRGSQSVTHGVVIRVLRSELKKKLLKDGIMR